MVMEGKTWLFSHLWKAVIILSLKERKQSLCKVAINDLILCQQPATAVKWLLDHFSEMQCCYQYVTVSICDGRRIYLLSCKGGGVDVLVKRLHHRFCGQEHSFSSLFWMSQVLYTARPGRSRITCSVLTFPSL